VILNLGQFHAPGTRRADIWYCPYRNKGPFPPRVAKSGRGGVWRVLWWSTPAPRCRTDSLRLVKTKIKLIVWECIVCFMLYALLNIKHKLEFFFNRGMLIQLSIILRQNTYSRQNSRQNTYSRQNTWIRQNSRQNTLIRQNSRQNARQWRHNGTCAAKLYCTTSAAANDVIMGLALLYSRQNLSPLPWPCYKPCYKHSSRPSSKNVFLLHNSAAANEASTMALL
jgi:hypothetical protein